MMIFSLNSFFFFFFFLAIQLHRPVSQLLSIARLSLPVSVRCVIVFCFQIYILLPLQLADYMLQRWTRPALPSATWVSPLFRKYNHVICFIQWVPWGCIISCHCELLVHLFSLLPDSAMPHFQGLLIWSQ